jgi:hypothetical protein
LRGKKVKYKKKVNKKCKTKKKGTNLHGIYLIKAPKNPIRPSITATKTLQFLF